VLIGFVWYMIQKDTLETQVARLDNISKSFEININLVLASQEVAAGLVFENFQHDNVIKTLLSEMQNADSLNFKALEKRKMNPNCVDFFFL
jgi:hypothetical protein